MYLWIWEMLLCDGWLCDLIIEVQQDEKYRKLGISSDLNWNGNVTSSLLICDCGVVWLQLKIKYLSESRALGVGKGLKLEKRPRIYSTS